MANNERLTGSNKATRGAKGADKAGAEKTAEARKERAANFDIRAAFMALLDGDVSLRCKTKGAKYTLTVTAIPADAEGLAEEALAQEEEVRISLPKMQTGATEITPVRVASGTGVARLILAAEGYDRRETAALLATAAQKRLEAPEEEEAAALPAPEPASNGATA